MPTRNHRSSKHSGQSNRLELDPELVHDLQNRLHCLEGHIRGIERMLEEHAASEDLLIQTNAVRAALNQVNLKIIEGQVEACMKEWIGEEDAPVTAKFRSVLIQFLKNG